MHTACLSALKNSLRGITPPSGVAYLLSRVDLNYWIPVATSDTISEQIPYYRLGYAFDVDAVANQNPKLINDEIAELVVRGKIEAVVFHSSFYQEVIPVGLQKPAALAIVRSSRKDFPPLSSDAKEGLHPVIELIHKIWEKQSFDSLTSTRSDVAIATPDTIAQSAARLLSDEFRFPPYFLLTDYVLSVQATETGKVQHICTNPLGYTCLLRKFLATNPPPWVGVMAERGKGYRENVRNPEGVTLEQAESYKRAVTDIGVLAVKLTDRLRDDVVLVACVPEGPPESARVKLWARHNRSMENPSIANQFQVQACKTPAEALHKLLEHSPYENKLKPNENDFLVVAWATWKDDKEAWKGIHVSCDTSHRYPLPTDQLFDSSWKTLFRAPNGDRLPRIEICFRSVENESSEKTNTAVESVLNHFYDQLVDLNPSALIESFWKSVVAKRREYTSLFKIADRHDFAYWINADASAFKPLTDLLIPDLKMIGHLGRWAGFKEYDANSRLVYIHLANGFKEARIPAQLVEFLLGKPLPSTRQQLEYVDGDGMDAVAFLQALYVLQCDKWELDFAEARDEVFGMSGTRAEVFAIGVLKSIDRGKWPGFVQNGFHDFNEEELKIMSGQLRTACTMLRKVAKKFGIIGQLEEDSKISLYLEFKGMRKP